MPALVHIVWIVYPCLGTANICFPYVLLNRNSTVESVDLLSFLSGKDMLAPIASEAASQRE